MRITRILTTFVLALGLTVWSAPIVYGAQSLTVNGHDAKSITLEVDQSCTVEVVSDDSTSYTDYIGFDGGVVLGTFWHLQTTKGAGDLADVTEYNKRPFYGYCVVADGSFKLPPSAGIHFVFEYEAREVGETDMRLYRNNPPPLAGDLLDSVHITVIPAPMGTAITYQGSLNDAGSPADGLYDFQFKLYDSITEGNQEGNTIDINDVDVIEGHFAVELDFGSDPNIFNGYARWLQIGVRPGDSNGVHTWLSPRIELMPTPYALYAKTAETAETAGGIRGGITGSGTANYLAKFTDANTLADSTIYESTGRVGIGTTSPVAKLHVEESGTAYAGNFEQTGSENTNGGLNVTTATGQYGAKILNQGGYSGYSYGLRAEATSTNHNAIGILSKAEAGSGSRSSLYGIYCYGDHLGEAGTSYGMYSDVDGSDAGDSYGIYSEGNKSSTDTAGTAYGGYFFGYDGRSIGKSYGVYGKAVGFGSEQTSYGVYGEAMSSEGTNYGVYGYAAYGTTNYAGYFDGDVRVNGNLMIYSGATKVLELGTGLDYAEGFDVSNSREISPGTVLIIDADNPGKLTLSTKPYDSKVAGIVGGGKGMGSGVRLGAGEFDYDVALAGRVYCNVDATEAGVQPGDLLTTSATPGYAMKSTDYARAQGAILGKAMESLEKGQKGQILVLVTLQ
jgi:hypothetical protein